MTLATKIRKTALATLAALPLVGGVAATEAAAEGYHVHAPARTAYFPHWDRLNIRKWPAAHSRKVAHVKVGRKVYVERCIIKAGTDWCKIQKGWKYGWVNGRYLVKGGYGFAHRHPWF